MAPLPHDRLIADALADYQARLDAGESPTTDEYAARLGDAYPAFCRVAAVEDALVGILHGSPSAGGVHDTQEHDTQKSVERPRLRLLGRRMGLAAAALLLLGLGLFLAGPFGAGKPPAPFEIRSVPVARVVVDGEARGTTPLKLSLAQGTHTVVLEQDGFTPRSVEAHAEAGAATVVEEILFPVNPEDRRSLARLEAGLLGTAANADVPPWFNPRGHSQHSYLLPTGRVLPDDVKALSVLVPEDLALESRLVFRLLDAAGNTTKILFDEVHRGTQDEFDLPVPPAVREALRPGARLEWGFETEGGPALTTQLEVAAEIEMPTRALAVLEARMEKAALPASLRAWLAARLLLAHDLPFAAWQRAGSTCLEPSSAPSSSSDASLLPCVARWVAVRALGLEDTVLGKAARRAILAHESERRNAFFQGGAGR